MIYGTFVVLFIPSVCRAEFFGHAVHAHSVRRWCWSAAVCSTGGGCQSRVVPAQTARLLLPWPRVRARRVGSPSRRAEWRERLGQPIDVMDRSVEELGPEPQAWWQRGQPMQLTMAALAEHVAVHEDTAMAAAAETCCRGRRASRAWQ